MNQNSGPLPDASSSTATSLARSPMKRFGLLPDLHPGLLPGLLLGLLCLAAAPSKTQQNATQCGSKGQPCCWFPLPGERGARASLTVHRRAPGAVAGSGQPAVASWCGGGGARGERAAARSSCLLHCQKPTLQLTLQSLQVSCAPQGCCEACTASSACAARQA